MSTPEGNSKFDYTQVFAACTTSSDGVKLAKIEKRLLYHFCAKIGIEAKSNWALFSKKIEPQLVLEQAIRDAIAQIIEKRIASQEQLISYVYGVLDNHFIEHLRLIGQREKTAAEQFYHAWFHRYLNTEVYYSILPSPDDRAEAFNEAFTKSIAKAKNGDFKRNSSLFTFFMKIFKDECFNVARRERKQNFEDLGEALQKEMEPNAFFLDTTLFERLRQHDPDCFDLVMRKLDGFRYEELAQELGVNTISIKNRLYNCKKKFAHFLRTGGLKPTTHE